VEYVSVEVARIRTIEDVTAVVGEEDVPLRAARGRVTVSPVLAEHALPPFDQSAMDGYAVRTRDFDGPTATFPVVGRQAAGQAYWTGEHAESAAVRIFTGAAIPDGFDAVVMQEECASRPGVVRINRRPAPGEHIRLAGDDVAAGAVIVGPDVLVDTRHIAIMAAAGIPRVKVRRRVRVAVFSTGNELREPHEVLVPGAIHDSNRAMLLTLLEAAAVELIDLEQVRDHKSSITEAIAAAARDSDIVISSGGVSVGEEDHVRTAVMAAGGQLWPLKAAIKPGKPASVGRLGAANLIGLPGNPVSALVTFMCFGRPIILRRMGLPPQNLSPIAAVAGFAETRKAGRDEFVPVVITGHDQEGRPIVEKRRRSGSARLSSLIDADGFARIPARHSVVSPGDPLFLYTFSGDFCL